MQRPAPRISANLHDRYLGTCWIGDGLDEHSSKAPGNSVIRRDGNKETDKSTIFIAIYGDIQAHLSIRQIPRTC